MLTLEQKKYISQNFSQTDQQLADFLNVSLEEVQNYTKSLHDVIINLKEQFKTHINNTNIVFDLIEPLNILTIISLPVFKTNGELSKSVESIKNLILAADNGQMGELLLESLKRSRSIDENYNEVYECINKWMIERENGRDIINPLHVFREVH